MAGKKCLFKSNSEEEIPDVLSSPCFEIGPNVLLKDVPSTGEEYLLKVMNERQRCALITKCEKDYSKYAKNQSCFVKETPQAKAPDKLIPTIEWQNIQVADFSDVRMYISRLKANKSMWPKNVKKIEIENNTLEGWKYFLSNHDPSLTCMLGMQSINIDRGLELLTEILGEVKPGDTIDHKTGQWIYSFLACTRQPLLSETTAILRDLSRKCSEIRSYINPESENASNLVSPLNIFICIIGRYFRQHDLADGYL